PYAAQAPARPLLRQGLERGDRTRLHPAQAVPRALVEHAARRHPAPGLTSQVEVRDVAPGLWLWRQPHPDWREGLGWEPEGASFCVESLGERIVLDPLAPPPA